MSGDNGNGEVKQEKTPEELAGERTARFMKDPDSFTENTELILAVKRDVKGMMVRIVPRNRQELLIAKGEIDYRIGNILIAMDIDQSEQSKPKILPANGSMINFARRK